MKSIFIFVLFAITATAFSQSKDSTTVKHFNKLSDSLTVKDSTALTDTVSHLKHKVRIDTLIPIYQKNLSEKSYIINNDDIRKMNYRYAGDILNTFPFSFTRDHGTNGYPNEIMIYGAGYEGINYLQDGIELNNRLTNSLDLNDIQTEYIDSIEVVPTPRGFLYGLNNNPVTVNFVEKDFVNKVPYSRIKYLQGADGEALLDVLFNAMIYKKLNASFDITNQKFDSTYSNTSFSSWKASIRLKYFLSNKINFIGKYSFLKNKVGLNGGVNIDTTIRGAGTDFLYEPTLAPVNYPYRNLAQKWHFFQFKMLGKFYKKFNTDLSLYYRFNQDEINDPGKNYLKKVNKNKIYGLLLQQDYSSDLFKISLNANYEKSDLKYYNFQNSTSNNYFGNENTFALSAIGSFYLLDSSFVPSVFYKFVNESADKYISAIRSSYHGIGFDLTYKYFHNLNFYFGYSNYQTAYNKNMVYNWEVGAAASISNFNLKVNLFKRNNFEINNNFTLLPHLASTGNLAGISAQLKFDVWKILLEGRSTYYRKDNSSDFFIEFPQFTFNGGVYFKGLLFNDNLNLKAGFDFNYIGKMQMPASIISGGIISALSQSDFTVAGVIQKVATIYLKWENLLDAQYYIIPYYPMRARNLRFGIAWELFD